MTVEAVVLSAMTELIVMPLAELLIRSRLPPAVAGFSVPVPTEAPSVRVPAVATWLTEFTCRVSLAPIVTVAALAPPKMLCSSELILVVPPMFARVLLPRVPVPSMMRTSAVALSGIALVPEDIRVTVASVLPVYATKSLPLSVA